jgi:Amt family ammonium transporter
VAGLVAVTPAAGASGPIGAMLLGMAASVVCYGFVGSLKNRLRLDDSLDVFGIHGLGGITGSIGTALVALPALGGRGGASYALGHQLVAQVAAVGVAIAWSAAGSAICYTAVRLVMPLRHARDAEREGLDIADHGERAYNY